MIKGIALLLVTAIFTSLFTIPSFAAQDEAYIIFAEKAEQSGMTTNVDNAEIVMRDGKEVIVLNPDTAAVNMNISMNGSFSGLDSDECVELTIKYYDEGDGKFTLYYDGEKGRTTYPEIIRMKNTCTWKEAEFFFQNPKFSKGVDGYDIQINLNNTAMSKSVGKIYISEIKAKKADFKSVYDVSFVTGNPGNAYFSDQELSIGAVINLKNGVNTANNLCNVNCEVRDSEGVTVWSKNFENVNLNGKYEIKIEPENLKYGVYDLYVTVENKEYNYKSTYSTYFSYAVAARKNPDLGMATHYGHSYPTPENAIYLLEKAGMGFIRDGIYWDTYEKQKGSYAIPPAHPVGKAYELLKQSSVDLLDLLNYGNVLYEDLPSSRYMPTTDSAIEAYSEFAKQVTEMAEPEYVEVWNEPNTTGFNPGNASWETYAKLLKATYPKIKAINEDIEVVGGSLVGIPMVSRDTVKQILDNGGGEYMDALAIHPYIWEASPMNDNLPNKISDLENFLTEQGYPDLKIWITEMGWGGGPGQQFTYEQQAAYLVQTYLVCKSFESFEKFVWYDFQCDGIVETNREHNFGLVNHWNDVNKPWAARKGYIAAAYMNDTFAGAEFVDKSEDGKNGYMYHYKNDGKDIYAIFSTETVYNKGLRTNKNDAVIADMYGNESVLYAQDGVFNILGGEEVTYIIGENLTLEFTEPTIKLSQKDIKIVLGESFNFEIGISDNQVAEYRAINDKVTVMSENNGNNAEISFGELVAGKEKIYITVKNQDRIYLSGYVTAECIPTVTATITNSLFNLKNFNRWIGKLTITNNSTQTAISGELKFSEPLLFAEMLPPVKIPEILPGRTKIIHFHFPEILRKEAYNLNAVAKLNNGDTVSISERIDFAVATYADVKPKIDGVIDADEWRMGSALAFNKKEQAYNLDNFTWNGKEDLSGKVCIEYDEENFYMAAVVTDDVHFQEEIDDKIWRGDSIQFGVGYQRANGNKNSIAYTEVGMALTRNGELVCNYTVEDVSIKTGLLNLEEEGIECKIKREGTTTVYELKMPWKCLVPRGAVFTGGKNVAFSMIVNDNDGQGRKGWLEYASGIGLTKNVNLFTFLKLMDKQ